MLSSSILLRFFPVVPVFLTLLTGMMACQGVNDKTAIALRQIDAGRVGGNDDANKNLGPVGPIVLENLPQPLTAQTSIKILVSGKEIVGYSFEIRNGESCNGMSGSDVYLVSQPIEKTLEQGNYLLCVVGFDTEKRKSEIKSFAWEVDPRQPTAIVAPQTPKTNWSAEFEAKVEGQNVENYRYKVALGILESEDCGDQDYSNARKLDTPIDHKMKSDGNFTVCLVGISKAGVEQAFPSVFSFVHDAMLPESRLTLESGDDLPSVVNGSELRLRVLPVNQAKEFSYKLLEPAKNNCYELKPEDYSQPAAFGTAAGATLVFSSEQLKEGIVAPEFRSSRTLCIRSEKPAAGNTIAKFVNVFQFYVDVSEISINEKSIVGNPAARNIPANPTVRSSFQIKIMPINPPQTTSTFNPATSYIHHKMVRFDTMAEAMAAPCRFDDAMRVVYRDDLPLNARTEKGFHQLCVMLENSAGTRSNSVPVVWYKDNIVASLPISNPTTRDVPRLANQGATADSLNKTLTHELSDPAPDGSTVSYRYKHFTGLVTCETNADPYVGLSSNSISIPTLDPAGSFHTLCVLATMKSAQGTVIMEQSQPSRFVWFRDGTRPDHTITGLPVGTSNDVQFTARMTAAKEGAEYSVDKDATKLFHTEVLDRQVGASCPSKTVEVDGKPVLNPDYKEKNFSSTGLLNVPLVRQLAAANNGKELMFCSFSRDKSGNDSATTKLVSWTFDTRIANLTVESSFRASTPSNKTTISFSIFGNPDHSGYKSKIVQGTSCGTDASGYPSTPNHLTSKPETLQSSFPVTGTDGPRTICVIAIGKDKTQQPFDVATSFMWVFDTTGPAVQLQTAPELIISGASVTQTLSVRSASSSDPALQYDFQLTSSTQCAVDKYKAKVALSTPLKLTSTVSAGKQAKFMLCLRGYDSAGNVGVPKVYTWSQTAPP